LLFFCLFHAYIYKYTYTQACIFKTVFLHLKLQRFCKTLSKEEEKEGEREGEEEEEKLTRRRNLICLKIYFALDFEYFQNLLLHFVEIMEYITDSEYFRISCW
jgi:hypothetical protein